MNKVNKVENTYTLDLSNNSIYSCFVRSKDRLMIVMIKNCPSSIVNFHSLYD